MQLIDKVKDDFRNDYTWNRAARLGVRGVRAFPRASAEYTLDKFPIISWLPRYNYRWIFNDVVAGLTVGLMLIPQGLSYAKLADIPAQYGLMSSWLPSAIYAVMGTSKDLSTGPTSLIGLLTSEVVADLAGDEYTPVEVASAVALMMGVYGMILGFLRLGFLLEFVSLPILSGFISAVAITIILNQMGSLLGEQNIGDGTAQQIHDIFHELPNAGGYDCAIGFTGIFFLAVLDHAYRRRSTSRILWLLSITRAFLCLVIFTGVGYAVNKSRGSPDTYLFSVAQIKANGQEPPTFPRAELIPKVASRSIAVFIGSAIEHTAIARGFAVKNNYIADQSQELTYYGVTNFFNSFFHAMGVGGAMSRTAVNSSCNVKSPLSGLVTTAVVLVSIFKLVGTLYWIPKATLSAIIICAVWPLISPPSVFYRYWKSSLADFVSSMIAFWVSLFASTELGIACSVGFNIVYIVLRQVFARVGSVGSNDGDDDGDGVVIEGERPLITLRRSESLPSSSVAMTKTEIPADTRVFRLGESVFFANAYAVRTSVLATIQTHHAPAHGSRAHGPEAERNWSVVAEQRTARLRRRAGIVARGDGGGGGDGDGDGQRWLGSAAASLSPIRVVVVDFGRANHVDTTAVTHLWDMAGEIAEYGGEGVELRFVGMSAYVRHRFERMGWRIEDAEGFTSEGGVASEDSLGQSGGGGGGGGGTGGTGGGGEAVTRMYPNVASAVAASRRNSSAGGEEGDTKKEAEESPRLRSSYRETV